MQNQACTNNVPSTSDPVAAKIASYRPTTLTDAQCTAWLPRVRELVSATPPADLQDALQMLTAACRFLADTDAPADRPVDEILTVDAIAMWATRALRSAVTNRPTAAAAGSSIGVTREAVRRSELRSAELFAEDPLISEIARRIAELAPCAPASVYFAAGLTTDDDMGVPLLVARNMLGLNTKAEISLHETDFGEVVVVASPAETTDILEATGELVRSVLSRQGTRCGRVESLIEELHGASPLLRMFELGTDEFDEAVSRCLRRAPIWLDGEGGFVSAVSRTAFVEGFLLLVGEADLARITEAFDSVFDTDVGGNAYERRVTSRLHEISSVVETRPGVWAHTAWGAKRVPTVSEAMQSVVSTAGPRGILLPDLIRQIQELVPGSQESTITTYAAAGLMFSTRYNRVFPGDGVIRADAERCRSMYRDHFGRWVWHSRRDDHQMYRSSLTVPLALFSVAELRLGEDMSIQFPTGSARCGYSANAVFFVSNGGVRDVLDAAGVEDGEEFMFVVTGPGMMECVRDASE